MKSEANGFWRGVVFIFEAAVIPTTISQTAGGDGLNVRPND
jgi:hypothetical protein